MERNLGPQEELALTAAASAAAAAALGVLLTGEHPGAVSVPLPREADERAPQPRRSVPLGFCERILEEGALLGYAGVVMTPGSGVGTVSGLLLTAHAVKDPAHFPPRFLDAGGRKLVLEKGVTLYVGPDVAVPGLQDPAGPAEGEAAYSAGRRQITDSLREAAAAWGYTGPIHCRLAALHSAFS